MASQPTCATETNNTMETIKRRRSRNKKSAISTFNSQAAQIRYLSDQAALQHIPICNTKASLPQEMEHYWYQRYWFWSKFDQGIMMDQGK
jgi:hypothetical protein